MKKKIAVFLVLSLLMVSFSFGCGNISTRNSLDKDDNTENDYSGNVKNIEDTDNEIVSVERFMEYYGVAETDIPRDYILDYIMQYRFTEDMLEKSDYWTYLSEDYESGVKYGTYPGSIFAGTPSELPLAEYINKADVIVIEFEMYYGDELYCPRRITLDLKNNKIFYDTTFSSDYTDAYKCEELTDEDVQSIRDELPKHISEKTEEGAEHNLDYTFRIMMKDPEYNIKGYSGNSGDELNYPGFDAYWKELYKKKFGEEFVFDKYEGYK